MSRAVRITNILVVVIPFAAFVAALATLWNEFVGPRDLVIGFAMYAVTLLGGLLHGSLGGALRGLLWGGLVRIFFVHHVTWSINSVCHYFGRRRFALEDHSTNVFWLALPSLGEAWHHNHHAFPRSAAHGLRWWELDPSAAVIRLMERCGLAWDVVRITPERQAEKSLRSERALTRV